MGLYANLRDKLLQLVCHTCTQEGGGEGGREGE